MPKAVLNVSGEAIRKALGLPETCEVLAFKQAEESSFIPEPVLQIKISDLTLPVQNQEGATLPAVSIGHSENGSFHWVY